MIGNDDIGGLGLAARTVNEAGRAEEWAFTAQAIVAQVVIIQRGSVR